MTRILWRPARRDAPVIDNTLTHTTTERPPLAMSKDLEWHRQERRSRNTCIAIVLFLLALLGIVFEPWAWL
ncbi:MAG TPA: hypothetical protein VK634_17140 [Reyranella sp.]|nr:hypothetical protein [Reyranella sp.]HTE82413.1 hypothetical protein [Reyranella sp.]